MDFKTVLVNFISSGIEHFESEDKELKIKSLNIFACIALISCLLSFIYNTTSARSSWLNYAGIILAIGVIILLRKTKNINLVITIDFFFTTIALWLTFYTGGQQGISVVWLCILPSVYFFLTNRITGTIWSLIALLGVVVLSGLQSIELIKLPYNIYQIIEVAITYIFLTVMMYIYSFLIEKKQQNINEKNISLEKAISTATMHNGELEDLQQKLKVSNDSLNQQLEEIKNLNTMMIGRELKMSELKQEIETLKQRK